MPRRTRTGRVGGGGCSPRLHSRELQDASKLVEYEWVDGVIGVSEIGRHLQHGFYGAHTATQVGLPVHISQGILEHTFAGPRFPQDLVTKIQFCVDQIDMAARGCDRWEKGSYVTR